MNTKPLYRILAVQIGEYNGWIKDCRQRTITVSFQDAEGKHHIINKSVGIATKDNKPLEDIQVVRLAIEELSAGIACWREFIATKNDEILKLEEEAHFLYRIEEFLKPPPV